MSQLSINIGIEEIVGFLGTQDRKLLLKSLQENGFIPRECSINRQGVVELPNQSKTESRAEKPLSEFDSAVGKLVGNSWRISKEDEDFIIGISQKFC